MIDIQLLRKHLDAVVHRLACRGFSFDLERFLELEDKVRTYQSLVEGFNAKRNKFATEIGRAKARGENISELLADQQLDRDMAAANDQLLEKARRDMQAFLASIPNPPHESVPIGDSSADNLEARRWGQPRMFSFVPKDHADIGEALGGLDFATATKISGPRFVIIKGDLARLHRAIAQFMLEVHTREHGYVEVYAPYIVNPTSAFGTGQLPKFEEDLFAVRNKSVFGGADVFVRGPINSDGTLPEGSEVKIVARDDKMYLIPTAEVPVTNIVRDEILEARALPLRYVCHTPCFRSEAGSYGKDTRGMIRQHQFDKVELVQIVHPSDSYQLLEELTGHAEAILRKLELPYRVVTLCTGDMGFSAAKTYDLEVWLPGQDAYREISSCSNFEAFQARRMQARFRGERKKPEHVHTLNGSGLAVGRTLVAILENFQNADGSVTVPDALRPFMGGMERITGPAC